MVWINTVGQTIRRALPTSILSLKPQDPSPIPDPYTPLEPTFSYFPLPPYTTAGVCVIVTGTSWQVMESITCIYIVTKVARRPVSQDGRIRVRPQAKCTPSKATAVTSSPSSSSKRGRTV